MADVEAWRGESIRMGYEWRVGTYRNSGTFASTAPGYGGAPFSPGAVGAPSSTSKLVRCGIAFAWTGTGTASSVLISPDWMAEQSGYVCAAVQTAGSPTVPSPSDPAPVGMKVNQQLTLHFASFGFSTSQGIYTLQSQGFAWSQGEDRTPPGAGLQVRPSFALNDATGGLAVFGSSSRWHYELQLRVLWFT